MQNERPGERGATQVRHHSQCRGVVHMTSHAPFELSSA